MHIEVENTIKALRRGDVILYPTDTIWGLGCDISQEKAIEKMWMLKHIRSSRSFIVLLDSADKLSEYVEDVPDAAYSLIESITKPLTIIYPKAKGIAKNVAAADGTVGIRITKHKFCSALIKEFELPIASTSANLTGETTPVGYDTISKDIIDNVDFIVNTKYDEHNETKASQIIVMQSNGLFTTLRN